MHTNLISNDPSASRNTPHQTTNSQQMPIYAHRDVDQDAVMNCERQTSVRPIGTAQPTAVTQHVAPIVYVPISRPYPVRGEGTHDEIPGQRIMHAQSTMPRRDAIRRCSFAVFSPAKGRWCAMHAGVTRFVQQIQLRHKEIANLAISSQPSMTDSVTTSTNQPAVINPVNDGVSAALREAAMRAVQMAAYTNRAQNNPLDILNVTQFLNVAQRPPETSGSVGFSQPVPLPIATIAQQGQIVNANHPDAPSEKQIQSDIRKFLSRILPFLIIFINYYG
jgi:hypothetical protein